MRHATAALTALTILVSTASWAHAQDAEPETHWSIGTDVSPWFLSGYSVIAGVEPAVCPGCRVQIEVWGFDFPEFYVELAEANAGEGWGRRVNVGGVLYLDYQSELGWHVGAAWSTFQSTVSREGATGELLSTEILGRVGWRFFLWEGLYVDPWVAAGPVWTLSPEPEVAGERYEESPVQILGTLHAGWRF